MECAVRQAESRQGGTACRTLRTFLFRSRYTRSIANFMKNVWTDSHGVIQSPSPGSSRLCFSNPVRRLALVSATSAAVASTVFRVRLRTLTFKPEEYHNTRNGPFPRAKETVRWTGAPVAADRDHIPRAGFARAEPLANPLHSGPGVRAGWVVDCAADQLRRHAPVRAH